VLLSRRPKAPENLESHAVIGVPRWLYRVYPTRMAIDMRKTHSYLKGLAEMGYDLPQRAPAWK